MPCLQPPISQWPNYRHYLLLGTNSIATQAEPDKISERERVGRRPHFSRRGMHKYTAGTSTSPDMNRLMKGFPPISAELRVSP